MKSAKPHAPSRGLRSPERLRRWRPGWRIPAGILVVSGGLFLAFRAPLWRQFAHWRAERFVNEGFRFWQSGQVREADLALQSAAVLDSANLRAWHLLARLYLQQGKVGPARAIFDQLMAAAPDETTRAAEARLYLDSLLATGTFADAAEFAVAQFSRNPTAAGEGWAVAAFHCARISGGLPRLGEIQADGWTQPGLVALRGLAVAHVLAQAGQGAKAAAALSEVVVPELGWRLRLAGAGLALELGDRTRARLFLYGGAGPRDPVEDLATAFMLATHSSRERELLAKQAFPAGAGSSAMLGRVNALLALESADLPAVVAAAWPGRPGDQSESVLAGLWLSWEINRPGWRDNPWKSPLAEKIHFDPLPLPGSRLAAEQFAGVVNRLPLSRDTVLALLARVAPVIRSGAVEPAVAHAP